MTFSPLDVPRYDTVRLPFAAMLPEPAAEPTPSPYRTQGENTARRQRQAYAAFRPAPVDAPQVRSLDEPHDGQQAGQRAGQRDEPRDGRRDGQRPPADDVRPAARPRVLIAGVGTGLAAAVLTLACQGLGLAGGRDAVRSAISDHAPTGSALFGTVVDATVESAYATLTTRATISMALAALVAVLTVLCLRAGLVARLAAVAAMALAGLVLTTCVMDVFPATARTVGLVALPLFPVSAALLFMPAVGGYRARRTGRTGRAGGVGGPAGAA